MGTISGINLLAEHARDRAAAGGNALIRASVLTNTTIGLGHRGDFIDELGDRRLRAFGNPVERVFPLDVLAAEGSDLVLAAYLLATDIFQVFGFTECPQFNRCFTVG